MATKGAFHRKKGRGSKEKNIKYRRSICGGTAHLMPSADKQHSSCYEQSAKDAPKRPVREIFKSKGPVSCKLHFAIVSQQPATPLSLSSEKSPCFTSFASPPPFRECESEIPGM